MVLRYLRGWHRGPLNSRRPGRGHAAGWRSGRVRCSFALAFSAFPHAVVDGLAAFFLSATLFVAFPAALFGGHQIEKAAISTGVQGR